MTGVFLLLSSLLAASGVLAAGGHVKGPVGTAPDRYVYFPGTEKLGQDEIRLIALGTGMPLARRSQAASFTIDQVMEKLVPPSP